MADCSKTLDFIKELHRMCHSSEFCSGCPLGGIDCDCRDIYKNHTRIVKIVQKWSDENPELKSCPFCGEAQNKGFVHLYEGRYYGKCHECGVHTMDFKTAHDLIEYWNGRNEK